MDGLPCEPGWYRLTGQGWEAVTDEDAETELATPRRGFDLVHVNTTAEAEETPLF